eukprot:12422713-Karenia_brevis.AAC.1
MEMRMNKIKVVSLGGKEIAANYGLTVGDLFIAYGHSQRPEAASSSQQTLENDNEPSQRSEAASSSQMRLPLENDNEQSQRSDSEASQASSSMTA